MGALAGMRILDLGTVLMAPYATQWLADLGADVIKVEAPTGDSTRYTGPSNESGMAAMFLGLNRNKRSVSLDLKSEQGIDALHRLIEMSDVLVHNIRPQKLGRLGLSPDQLKERYPALICASLTGFTANGPYGGRPAYDDIIQGLCGNADLMARQIGRPRYLPMVSADKTSGLIAAIAILAKYVETLQTGIGGAVEVPMFESMVAFNLVEHFYGAHFDPAIGEMGYNRALASTRGPFETSDGYVSMMPYTDAHWHNIFAQGGGEHYLNDERFKNIESRTSNIEILYEMLGDLIRKKSTDYWLRLCEDIEVPVAPVLGLDELQDDPHLKEVGFFKRMHDPSLGSLRFPGIPVIMDDAELDIRIPPRLGEHTTEVLAAAGMDPDSIEQLIAKGVARQYRPAGINGS